MSITSNATLFSSKYSKTDLDLEQTLLCKTFINWILVVSCWLLLFCFLFFVFCFLCLVSFVLFLVSCVLTLGSWFSKKSVKFGFDFFEDITKIFGSFYKIQIIDFDHQKFSFVITCNPFFIFLVEFRKIFDAD